MRILLVDDHILFRAGLSMLLHGLRDELEVIECGSGEQALQLACSRPDIRLCLLDLSLRGESGMSLVAQIRQINPDVSVIVVSADEHPATVRRALSEGAAGYIPKSATPEAMKEALERVLDGAPCSDLHASPDAATGAARARLQTELTDRQYDVLQCLLRGWPNKLISRHLNLSDNTVKTHLQAIYRSLGVTTRAQAVIAANRLGLHALPEPE